MSQLSQKKLEDDYASKKKRLHPRPEDDEPLQKSHKKLISATKSISKSKLSTQKKCEVTFSEGVEEITDAKDSQQNDKENNRSVNSTPFKTNSPSKTSLKSVKEHIKTPFSKIKDNSQELLNTPNESRSIANSATKITNQPNFNKEIMKESESKNSNSVTPQKSSKKVDLAMNSKLKSRTRSKSPLVKIKEEKNETVQEENNSNEQNEKNSHRVEVELEVSVNVNATAEEVKNIKEEENINNIPAANIHADAARNVDEEKCNDIVKDIYNAVKDQEEIPTEFLNIISENTYRDNPQTSHIEVDAVKEEGIIQETSIELENVKESSEIESNLPIQKDEIESSQTEEN
jgi:hypothetical protein